VCDCVLRLGAEEGHGRVGLRDSFDTIVQGNVSNDLNWHFTNIDFVQRRNTLVAIAVVDSVPITKTNDSREAMETDKDRRGGSTSTTENTKTRGTRLALT
jgi:hypothetical protein